MRSTLLESNQNISASELLSCTQRFDLTPMPKAEAEKHNTLIKIGNAIIKGLGNIANAY